MIGRPEFSRNPDQIKCRLNYFTARSCWWTIHPSSVRKGVTMHHFQADCFYHFWSSSLQVSGFLIVSNKWKIWRYSNGGNSILSPPFKLVKYRTITKKNEKIENKKRENWVPKFALSSSGWRNPATYDAGAHFFLFFFQNTYLETLLREKGFDRK